LPEAGPQAKDRREMSSLRNRETFRNRPLAGPGIAKGEM